MAAYDRFFETNQVGQVDDTSMRRIDSWPTNTNLQFGTLVTLDTFNGSWGVEPWGAEPTQIARGITVYDATKIEGYYPIDTMASILTFGRVIVLPIDDVDVGDPAFAKANGRVGTLPAIPAPFEYQVGFFLTSANAGEKAVLEFLPSVPSYF